MDVATAVIIGIIGGVVGITPYFVARRRIKAKMKKDGTGGLINGMAATLISFLIMVVEILLCYLLAANSLLPFALSAIVVFLLAMGVYTATLMRR